MTIDAGRGAAPPGDAETIDPTPGSGLAAELSPVATELLDAVPDGVLVCDTDGVMVFANAALEALFSYGEGDMVGLRVEQLVPHGLRDSHQANREAYQDDPHRRPMGALQRLSAVTRHGSLFFVEVSLSPFRQGDHTYIVATVRDVTARIDLESAHRRVMASLNASHHLVLIVDPETLWITYANQGAERLSGFPTDELTAMTPLSLLPLISRAQLVELVDGASRQQEMLTQTDLLCADGLRVPVELRVALVDGSDGPPGCVIFGQDLTERRRVEAERQAVLDKLRRVAVATGISIWAMSPDGVITFAQGAEWDHVGRLHEMLDRTVGDVFGPFDEVVEAFEAALAGEEPSIVVKVDGDPRQVSFQPVLGTSGRVEEVIGIAVDVGELEASRRELEVERDRLSAIYRSVGQGMLIVTEDGRVEEANQVYCGLVGRSRNEVLASTWPFPFLDVSEEERDESWRIIRAGGHVEFVASLIRPDGSRVPVMVTADGVSGRPDHALVFFSDLSARERFEADLDAANAVLIAADERERIARELHDRVIQRIFATGISLQSTQNRTADSRVAARLGQAVEELDLIIRELRTSVFELHQSPSTGATGVRRDVLGIIEEATRVLGFRPDVRFEGVIEDLDVSVEADLLAVIRESLTNVARHAHATMASVTVTVESGAVDLVVDDNGVGMSSGGLNAGHGIGNMVSRAEARGGTFELAANEGRSGSTLHWRVPL
ncbi:MAG: PAS domain S-box protein [Microthrixaceae bacterium]